MNTPAAATPPRQNPTPQPPKSVAARFDGIIRRLTKSIGQRPA